MKQIIPYTIFLFVYVCAGAQAKEKIVLNEDFSSNKNNWPISESVYRTSTIANGKYIMRDTMVQDMWAGIPVVITETGNYSISATANHMNGSGDASYGISFGGKDVYDCYNFSISANGRYLLYKIEKSKITNIINWTTDKNIIPGNNTTNKLTIVKQGQTWQFLINNALVNSCPASRFFGNITGFEKTHSQWVEFDDLVITDLNTAPVPMPSSSPGNFIRDTIYPCQLIEKLPKYREENFVSITGSPVLNSPSQNKYYSKFAVTSAAATTISYFSENNFSFDAEFARCKTEAEAKKKLDEIKSKFEACNGKPYVLRHYITNALVFTVNTPTGFRELGIMLAVLPDASSNEYTVNLNTSSYDRESIYQYITSAPDSSVLSKNLRELAEKAQNKFAAITGKKLNTDNKTYKTYYECKYQLTGAIKNEMYELYNRCFEAVLFEKITDGGEADRIFASSFESTKNALGKGYMYTQETIKNSQSYKFFLNDLLYHSGMIFLIKEKEADGSYTIKLQVQSIPQ